MTEVTVTGNSYEDQMHKMVEFSVEFRKKFRDIPFSLDYGNGRATLSLTQSAWTSGYAKTIQEIAEPFGYSYSVHPTGTGKLLISVGG